MPDIHKIQLHNNEQLTAAQKDALKQLHTAATQFEGVFMEMVFKAMRDTVPKDSLFSDNEGSQETFSQMLDQQRSQSLANTGAMGIAKVMEEQLRASVLADAEKESKVHVNREVGP